MKTNKIFSIIALCFLFSYTVFAQNFLDGLHVQYNSCQNCGTANATYGNTENMDDAAHIASDFGPRNLGDDWHGGVDFNSASDYAPRDLSSINQAAYDRSEEVSYY